MSQRDPCRRGRHVRGSSRRQERWLERPVSYYKDLGQELPACFLNPFLNPHLGAWLTTGMMYRPSSGDCDFLCEPRLRHMHILSPGVSAISRKQIQVAQLLEVLLEIMAQVCAPLGSNSRRAVPCRTDGRAREHGPLNAGRTSALGAGWRLGRQRGRPAGPPACPVVRHHTGKHISGCSNVQYP